MHFDAACRRVLLALTVAAGRADSGGGPYPEPDLAGRSRTQARPDGLPDCLNHERFSGRNSERRLLASKKWSRHDADTFEMDRGGWGCGRCSGEHELIARATKDPRWLDHSGRGIEILDDAAACGIPRSRQDLQYRMDAVSGHRDDDASAGGGSARLRDAGAIVAGERRGRRKPESLHRGPTRLRKARRLLPLLGG